MELNTNSTVNLPSDTINIIFEFAQPGSEETSENGGEIISERTGDQVVDLVHYPAGSHGDPAVPAERSATNDVNCLSRSVATQETLQHDDERIKNHVTERTLTETSMGPMSNLRQMSISNPQQPWISNSLQPSILSLPHLPTMMNLRIQNGQVVQRVYVQTPVQTQAFQKEKTSGTRPTQVKKKSNNKKGEDTQITKKQVEDTPIINSTKHTLLKKVESTPITNSTKLALLNFLKKKSVATVSETNGKSGENNVDPEIQILSPVGGESNACNKDRTCSDQLSNTKEDLISVSARTERLTCPEIISIAESVSPNPVQSSQNSYQSPNELTSTAVQSISTYQPSNKQSDVTGVNGESTEKELKQTCKNFSVHPCTKGKTPPL